MGRDTPGYSALAVQYMSRRYAGRDATFLLPHLRLAMSVLDCGCGPPEVDRFVPFRKHLCLAFAQDDDFFAGTLYEKPLPLTSLLPPV